MLFLVRHPCPRSAPKPRLNSSNSIQQDDEGPETLKHVIPPGALLVSSQEPKARQTLEPTGHVFTDVRFNEVSRNEPFHGDFRTRRRAYINGTDHPGWEPRQRRKMSSFSRQVAQGFVE